MMMKHKKSLVFVLHSNANNQQDIYALSLSRFNIYSLIILSLETLCLIKIVLNIYQKISIYCITIITFYRVLLILHTREIELFTKEVVNIRI